MMIMSIIVALFNFKLLRGVVRKINLYFWMNRHHNKLQQMFTNRSNTIEYIYIITTLVNLACYCLWPIIEDIKASTMFTMYLYENYPTLTLFVRLLYIGVYQCILVIYSLIVQNFYYFTRNIAYQFNLLKEDVSANSDLNLNNNVYSTELYNHRGYQERVGQTLIEIISRYNKLIWLFHITKKRMNLIVFGPIYQLMAITYALNIYAQPVTGTVSLIYKTNGFLIFYMWTLGAYESGQICGSMSEDVYEAILQVCWPVWSIENKKLYLNILAFFQKKRYINIGFGDIIDRHSEIRFLRLVYSFLNLFYINKQ
ncbi:hypothetical protein GWI33_004794 [Rhynchophorus ferrugineus]|uniref:Odorant receptor n=1 Tax=Rhynchophorus ferrugineus TaxID=354439 RepID=A0A834MK74_RHYFE|nr:hypothetical protein GWI33_004794 [Rhynchophorus ferrugineus]